MKSVNFATSRNLIVRSTALQQYDIHKHTGTSPDRITHNQTDHILFENCLYL